MRVGGDHAPGHDVAAVVELRDVGLDRAVGRGGVVGRADADPVALVVEQLDRTQRDLDVLAERELDVLGRYGKRAAGARRGGHEGRVRGRGRGGEHDEGHREPERTGDPEETATRG